MSYVSTFSFRDMDSSCFNIRYCTFTFQHLENCNELARIEYWLPKILFYLYQLILFRICCTLTEQLASWLQYKL